jgi:hypothetical protein
MALISKSRDNDDGSADERGVNACCNELPE